MDDGEAHGRRRRPAAWLSTILVVLAGLVLGPAPAARGADEPPPPGLSEDRLCELAGTLNADARPRAALALLDEYRDAAESQAQACAAQHTEARARIALARTVGDLADAQLTAAVAREVEALCLTFPRTRQQAIAACDAAGAQTWAAARGADLERFADDWVTPLRMAALVALGYLAALYVLARSWTRHLDPDWLRLVTLPRYRRALVGWGGAVVVLAGLAALLALVAHAPWQPAAWWATAALWAVLTLLGVHLVATLLGSRLRISVVVRGPDGAEDAKGAAHVVALLDEMGAGGPAGAEYPRGTDVSALDDAVVSALPVGRVAKLVLGVVSVFVPRAPWEVIVDEESADLAAVQIRRNGRSELAAVVDRDELGLRTPLRPASDPPSGTATTAGTTTATGPPDLPDLHRVTAAIVLSRLRRPHGLTGLGGASEWRSIALQTVATTDLRNDRQAAVPLLARAVTADERNFAARLPLLNFRFRAASDVADLDLYESRLEDLLTRIGADEEFARSDADGAFLLTQRARLNRVVALINRAYTQDAEAPLPGHLARARTLAATIVGEPVPAGAAAPLRRLAQAIARDAAILAVVGLAVEPPPAETSIEYYQTACHYATRPQPDRAAAVRFLRLAAVDPELAQWRTTDPQLAPLRRTDEYRAAFAPAPTVTSFLALPGFAELRTPLARLGITDEATLLAHRPAELAARLGLTTTATRRLLALVRLATRVPAPLARWRFDIAVWLTRATTTAARRSGLAAGVQDRFGELLSDAERALLLRWLRRSPDVRPGRASGRGCAGRGGAG